MNAVAADALRDESSTRIFYEESRFHFAHRKYFIMAVFISLIAFLVVLDAAIAGEILIGGLLPLDPNGWSLTEWGTFAVLEFLALLVSAYFIWGSLLVTRVSVSTAGIVLWHPSRPGRRLPSLRRLGTDGTIRTADMDRVDLVIGEGESPFSPPWRLTVRMKDGGDITITPFNEGFETEDPSGMREFVVFLRGLGMPSKIYESTS